MVLKGGVQKDAGFWRRLLGGLGQLARQAGPVIGQGLQAFANANLNFDTARPRHNAFLGSNFQQGNSIPSSDFGGLKTQPIQSPDFQDLQTTSALLGQPNGNHQVQPNLQGGSLPNGFTRLNDPPVQRRPTPNQQAQFRQIPNSPQIPGNFGVQTRIQAEAFPQQVNTQNAFAARQRQQQMLQAMAQAQRQAAIEHNMAMRRALARRLDETLRQRDFSLSSATTPEPAPTPTQQPVQLRVEKQGPVAPEESDLMKETRVRIFADAVQQQLSFASRDSSGNVIYRDVALDPDVAPLVMYADVKHKARTGKLLTKEQLLKAAEAFGKGVFDFVIGDDINTLTDPTVNPWGRVIAGISIASNFGGVVPFKVGGKVAFKGFQRLAQIFHKYQVDEVAELLDNSEDSIAVLRKGGFTDPQIKKYKEVHGRPWTPREGPLKGQERKVGPTEVYKTKDGKAIYRTKVRSLEKPDKSFAIWETAVDRDGKVLLEGHADYTIKADGREFLNRFKPKEVNGKTIHGKVEMSLKEYLDLWEATMK
ncbi:MAG: hypothetical protein KTR14_08090 [Vampirovibrio sp.]|nr:hypothetical protein [Vampirovibrio sp.]